MLFEIFDDNITIRCKYDKNNQNKRKIKIYFTGRKIYMCINFVVELYFIIIFV